MEYDRADSFAFDFELNEIPFGSKSKGKLSPQPYPIRFEREWKYSFRIPARKLKHITYINSTPGCQLIVVFMTNFDTKFTTFLVSVAH